MTHLPRHLLAFGLLSVALGCTPAPVEDDQAPATSQPRTLEPSDAGDAGESPDGGSKASGCSSSFGDALTEGFGRVDGLVTAVVTPADTQCAMPNSDHVVVQVQMKSAVYRMVVNVQSSFGDPKVRLGELRRPLPGPAWEEGWHPGLTLDYPADLSVHSDAGFEPLEMDALVARLSEAIQVGARISVFAHSSGGTYSHSAHKIHRNKNGEDGALVLDPTSKSPTLLLFHFANQTF